MHTMVVQEKQLDAAFCENIRITVDSGIKREKSDEGAASPTFHRLHARSVVPEARKNYSWLFGLRCGVVGCDSACCLRVTSHQAFVLSTSRLAALALLPTLLLFAAAPLSAYAGTCGGNAINSTVAMNPALSRYHE